MICPEATPRRCRIAEAGSGAAMRWDAGDATALDPGGFQHGEAERRFASPFANQQFMGGSSWPGAADPTADCRWAAWRRGSIWTLAGPPADQARSAGPLLD